MGLVEEVKEIAKRYFDEEGNSFVSDLMRSGCISGMVSELIYYKDTTAFFARHKEEINELLSETLAELETTTSLTVSLQNTIKGWDLEDPLCLEQNNQNLVAWFVFEEIIFDTYPGEE